MLPTGTKRSAPSWLALSSLVPFVAVTVWPIPPLNKVAAAAAAAATIHDHCILVAFRP